jgi:Uma2 family endonuclease
MASALPHPLNLQCLTVADLSDLLLLFGKERICLSPPPGSATERDVADAKDRFGVQCELIDGTLVKKTMGFFEALIATRIAMLLDEFVRKHNLGIVVADGGLVRLSRKQIRVPDVAFFDWDRIGDTPINQLAVFPIAPNLAVEVLSSSNRKREMKRKLGDYFTNGVELVWYIDPRTKSATAYTSPTTVEPIGPDGVLRGGSVLPGFMLKLAALFAEPKPPKSRKQK